MPKVHPTASTVPATMMALMAWNVLGMNKDLRIWEIKNLLVAKKIHIFGLNETKIKRRKFEDVSH